MAPASLPSPFPQSPSGPPNGRLEEVAAALFATDPAPRRLVLFGSTARGEARPDSDLDLLVILPVPSLAPVERQQTLWRLRQALAPLHLRCGVDLVVVARALREGKDLHDSR